MTKWRLRVNPVTKHSQAARHRVTTTTTTTTHHALRSKVVDRRLKRLLDLAQQVHETERVVGVGVGAGEAVSLGLEKVDGQLQRRRQRRQRRQRVVAGRVRRRL